MKSNNDLELEEKVFHYLSYSLFDVAEEVLQRNESKTFDEKYGFNRFGAAFLNYNCLNQVILGKINTLVFKMYFY